MIAAGLYPGKRVVALNRGHKVLVNGEVKLSVRHYGLDGIVDHGGGAGVDGEGGGGDGGDQ